MDYNLIYLLNHMLYESVWENHSYAEHEQWDECGRIHERFLYHQVIFWLPYFKDRK